MMNDPTVSDQMDPKTVELIDRAKDKAMKDEDLTREELIDLIDIDPDSEECDYLGKAAREVKRKNTGDVAHIGTSIGLDLRPCPMSCKFCSLGEKWGLIDGEYELSDDTVMGILDYILGKGFNKVTLRTTEFYPIERLCEIAKKLRAKYGQLFGMSANTGELTPEKAKMLKEAGFNGIYHAIRLREGIDTPLSVETRIATIKAAQSAGLRVSSGIDPIGVEHTSEEIADLIMLYRELKVDGMCTMKRINIPGTPLEGVPEISERRLAQITAVNRLAGGSRWTVATHPITRLGLEFGADHVSVETGANPRDNNLNMLRWSQCDHDAAFEILKSAGCTMGSVKDYFKNR